MSTLALDDEQARALEAAAANKSLADVMLEMRAAGVRESSLSFIEDGIRKGLRAAGFTDEDVASRLLSPDLYAPMLEAYAPDEGNNLALRLKNQLALAAANPGDPSKQVRVTVHSPGPDGRAELVRFEARESAAYFAGTAPERAKLCDRKIRERRLNVAIAAALKVRESGGIVSDDLTVDERLCLNEYGALERKRKRVLRESGAIGYEQRIVLREGFLTHARAALATKRFDLQPVKLREAWNYDGLTAEVEEPIVGGLVGTGRNYPAEVYTQFGPQVIQTYLSDTWDEQAKCRLAFQRDPFAKQGVRISTNFTIGRGFNVVAADEKVQAVLDEFQERHTQSTIKKWLRSSKIMGDLALNRIRLGAGRLEYRKIPAQTIWEITTVNNDLTRPLYLTQRYTTNFQQFATPENGIEYVDRIIPAAEIAHFKRNAEEDEVRGRSDIFAALAWHLKFRNIWEAEIEKSYATAAYAYRAKIKGNQAAVNSFLQNAVPKGRIPPGSWLAFNDKVEEFDVVQADKVTPSGTGSVSEGILNALSANYGFSKEYFGVSGNRTRGGAVMAAGPSEKGFEDEQDDYGEFLQTQVFAPVVAEAKAFGLLDGVQDFSFNVVFPEIIKADAAQRIVNLVIGRAQGVLSQRTFASLFYTANDLGDVDYDDEQAQIAAEKALGINLPAMPAGIDKVDPAVPNPTSASGQGDIRQGEMNPSESDVEYALATLREAGGFTVVRA